MKEIGVLNERIEYQKKKEFDNFRIKMDTNEVNVLKEGIQDFFTQERQVNIKLRSVKQDTCYRQEYYINECM